MYFYSYKIYHIQVDNGENNVDRIRYIELYEQNETDK